MAGAAPKSEPRPVNPALMFGLVAVPIIFAWFLFWPGYSNSLRTVVFIYAFLPTLLVLVGLLFSLLARAIMPM